MALLNVGCLKKQACLLCHSNNGKEAPQENDFAQSSSRCLMFDPEFLFTECNLWTDEHISASYHCCLFSCETNHLEESVLFYKDNDEKKNSQHIHSRLYSLFCLVLWSLQGKMSNCLLESLICRILWGGIRLSYLKKCNSP